MRQYKRAAYANSTKKTYRAHLRAYLRFCTFYGYVPVPASQDTLLSYVAFLARTLQPSTINGYLNIVRILHIDANLCNPLENNYELLCVKRGIARTIGQAPNPKLGVTPELLMKLFDFLDLESSFDRAFWFAMLVGFFCFLRKASLVPISPKSPGDRCLILSDLSYDSVKSALSVSVRVTKTIQFAERTLSIPLVPAPDNPALCPITAWKLWRTCAPNSPTLPLFSFMTGNTVKWITHSTLVGRFRELLAAGGFDASRYSGHSLRRGGAEFSARIGLSHLVIQLRGDWKSQAYLRYVSLHDNVNLNAAHALALGVQNLDRFS